MKKNKKLIALGVVVCIGACGGLASAIYNKGYKDAKKYVIENQEITEDENYYYSSIDNDSYNYYKDNHCLNDLSYRDFK